MVNYGGAGGAAPGLEVTALGLLAMTAPVHGMYSTQVVGGQDVLYFLCTAAKSGTVAALGLLIETAGVTAGTGSNQLGLYTEAGVRIGETGDMTTAFGTAGFAEGAVSGSPAVTAGDNYYLAVTANFTGTMLQLFSGTLVSDVNVPALNGHRLLLSQTGQAALPASFTPSALSLASDTCLLYAR